MSLFLGPIHYWMYEKIENNWRRERAIFKTYLNRYGPEALDVAGKSEAYYQAFNNGKPLEELAEGKSIHSFLQGELDRVEVSEAKLISAFARRYGEEAAKLAIDAAYAFGRFCGEEAARSVSGRTIDLGGARELFLRYQLDGMPCDRVTEVVEADGGLLCIHYECLHQRNWEEAQADFGIMCDVVRGFTDGFHETLGIHHQRRKAIAYGDEQCEDFYRKGKVP